MWQTLKYGAYIINLGPLPKAKVNVFENKLLLFRDKNYDVCREMWP